MLAKVYLALDINHEQILHIMANNVTKRLLKLVHTRMTKERPPVEIKYRSNVLELRFAVGMVMQHRELKYTCVIYGWDKECAESTVRIHQVTHRDF